MFAYQRCIAFWFMSLVIVFISGCGSSTEHHPSGVLPNPLPNTGIYGVIDPSLIIDNVLVSFEANGTVVSSVFVCGQTGEFSMVGMLAPGTYDVVITADGHATAVIAGVPVSAATSTSIATMVSTSVAPITLLPTSTMRTISGTVTLNPTSASTVAYVASKQTFSGGPTVAVKTQAANQLSGTYYSLLLPVDAPLLGHYGTGTLPIVLVPQPAVASKFTAEASAAGYVTQSVSADISVADVIQNFSLTP